jgi:hypothetical protein
MIYQLFAKDILYIQERRLCYGRIKNWLAGKGNL